MIMKFKKLTAAVLTACLALAGCATVFSGSTQTVNFKVVDGNGNLLPGAICTVYDPAGSRYALTHNPGSVVLSRGQGALRVECHKKGYHQVNTAVGDNFNPTTLVNVLFWPGFIVDAASGAYKKYPSHYLVTMEKK